MKLTDFLAHVKISYRIVALIFTVFVLHFQAQYFSLVGNEHPCIAIIVAGTNTVPE